MNISLTPELETFIQSKVGSGLYTSASEVIREALRLLKKYNSLHEKSLRQLNHEIDKGILDAKKGKFVDPVKARQQLRKKINSM